MVSPQYESRSTALNHLNSVHIFFGVWVPDDAAVFEMWANKREVSLLTKVLRTAPEVPTEKTKESVGLLGHIGDMCTPGQIG